MPDVCDSALLFLWGFLDDAFKAVNRLLDSRSMGYFKLLHASRGTLETTLIINVVVPLSSCDHQDLDLVEYTEGDGRPLLDDH